MDRRWKIKVPVKYTMVPARKVTEVTKEREKYLMS